MKILLAIGMALGFASGTVLAQAPARSSQVMTLEESLFVLKPDSPGVKGVHVVWIPPPLQKYCLGKTHKECSAIDFCLRTTSRQVTVCRNLSVDVNQLPPYPPDVRPRRVISVVYFPAADMPGFEGLLKFFESAPAGVLDRLSLNSRIKAKIKFSRSTEDDDFDLLEVLAVPRL